MSSKRKLPQMETIPHGVKYDKLIFFAQYGHISEKGANLLFETKSASSHLNGQSQNEYAFARKEGKIAGLIVPADGVVQGSRDNLKHRSQ